MQAIKALYLDQDEDPNLIPLALKHQADFIFQVINEFEIRILKNRFSPRGIYVNVDDIHNFPLDEEE